MPKAQKTATDELLARLQTVFKDAARVEKEVKDGESWLENRKEDLRGLYALQDSYMGVLDKLGAPKPLDLSPRMPV